MSLVIFITMRVITKPINTSFRKLGISDAESLFDLESTNTKHPWSFTNFETSLADLNTISDGLFVKDKLVGYILTLVAFDTADILNIGVHPDFKRLGCGKMLLDHLLAQLQKTVVCDLILEVRIENHIAINFYQKQGFVTVGTREKYYSNLEDAKIMKLHIPQYK